MGSIASYKNGFYSPRRGGSPRYPSLWRGCVGAWCPSLGATGSRLFDQSLFQNHGTLINMDASTDWPVSGDGVALDFDGGNEYVDGGSSSVMKPATALSVSAWVNLSSSPTSAGRIISARTSATSNGYILAFDAAGAAPRLLIGDGAYATALSATAIPTLTWSQVTGTWDGATVRIFVNGISTGSSSKSAITYTAGALTIAAEFNPTIGAPLSGRVDDIRIYNRALTTAEIKLLATRRRVAYDLAPRRSYRAPTAAATNYRRNHQLIGSAW